MIYNVNNFHKNCNVSIGNMTVVCGESDQWKLLILHYIAKQRERNSKMQALLEMLREASAGQQAHILEGLHVLQEDNEQYLKALAETADVSNGQQ
ncbi:MAG: hypothetical protein BGO21_22305 [Dyadobacter sp. 50-39]|uniref:hypothetical protein n=1 Tax=Dyadobacter sp. 50-39 TaxID=1895756 RepID=UPI0009653EFC|nr:hypothetical protein [Dyadobacter sp. 50-39]OJV18298.1 MAG: hypothetical protein BGO21_22305 [Dyadobacter sp. 50-39]